LVAGAGLSACESSQTKNARLAKQAKTLLRDQKGLVIGARNVDVRVVSATVLHDANGSAAVVSLRTSKADQAQVPLAITVQDAKGRPVFRNDAPGLDPSLTSIALLRRGHEAIWVNNQVIAASTPKSVKVAVGAAKGKLPTTVPKLSIVSVRFDSDSDGIFARGEIRNLSRVAQRRLTVYCLSRRGSRVIAAGRAVIDKLLPYPTKKPTRFSVFFIGNPKGGRLACSAPPTVLTGGPS
jgi:hypothetical protein